MLGVMFKEIILSRRLLLTSTNVESTPSCAIGGREGVGWWAWRRSPGAGRAYGLEGAAGDWRPDLVNKSAQNNSLVNEC